MQHFVSDVFAAHLGLRLSYYQLVGRSCDEGTTVDVDDSEYGSRQLRSNCSQREAGLAGLLHALATSQPVRWCRYLSGWVLIPFLFRRSRLGQSLARSSAKARFLWRRFWYRQRERTHSARVGSRSSLLLFRTALGPVFYALLAYSLLSGLCSVYARLPGRLYLDLPLPSVDTSSYVSVLSTIAQASAAMLALFFTAISVVASTSYAKVGTRVRALVASDDLNRRYLRLLAHLTAVCIVALVTYSLGAKACALVLLYVTVLSALSILGFFVLGARTFALLSPTELLLQPYRSFVRAVHAVTPDGKRWLDASFQHHSSRVAITQLETIEELATAAMSDRHPSMRRAVHGMAVSVHQLLRFYASRKLQIPSSSEWYAKKAKFAVVQLGMGTETEIALQTGVTLPATPVPNHEFVEEHLDKTLIRCLHPFVADPHVASHGPAIGVLRCSVSGSSRGGGRRSRARGDSKVPGIRGASGEARIRDSP